ncbi:MAG: hypothetical protein HZB33_09085 [Nitrospirae bacterium]|nr:hypothetical protein [Nitrospirota bacterium]
MKKCVQMFFCHSRGLNRESTLYEKQNLMDSRLRGNDGNAEFIQTFAKASFIILLLMLTTVAPFANADTSIINIYDANGSLVTGDGRYYEYNDANQLVRVRQGDTIAGPVISEYFYDASGQRVKKIENGVITYYVGKHFEKQVGGANAGNTSYYFGDGGERVAKKDPAGNIFYYHLDHLDGINAVTDSAGTVVARTDYLPFGDLRAGNSGSEKYAYTGKEMDKTSLYYFDARYNSPEFRHFTQADIAEPDYSDPQDLNRYSYVGNNPLSYVDYDGYKKKKKKHLSKREQRARSLGLNPDKDKYKVGKMSDREYKKALVAHKAASKPKSSMAGGSGYQLAGFGTVRGKASNMAFSDQGKAWDEYIHGQHTYIEENKTKHNDDWRVGDWCGSEHGGDFPDQIWGIDMRHGCFNHDHGYENGRTKSDKWKADIHLGDDIFRDNRSWNPARNFKASIVGTGYFLAVLFRGDEAFDNAH